MKNANLRSAGRPVDIQRLSNGNTLISFFQGRQGQVIELDRSNKKIIWQLPVQGYMQSVQRLENGNTLVCIVNVFSEEQPGSRSGQVVEYNQAKQVVWKLSAKLNRPWTVQRLPNGNTLVSDSSGLSEYDRSGKTIKKWWSGENLRFHRY